MAESRWRGVLAGLGNHGPVWAEVCRQHPAVELAGLVAAARPRGAGPRTSGVQGVPGERIDDTLERAIANRSPDFVLDITSPESHREIALASFDAGSPLLQAKPMSDDYRSAAEIVAPGTPAGCTHMVAQVQRFDAAPRLTRRLLLSPRCAAPGRADAACD